MRRRRGDADQDAILRRARVFILAIAFGGREARAVQSMGQRPRRCARSKSGRGGEEPSWRRQREAPPTRRRRAHVCRAGRVHGPVSPQESQSRRAGACPSLTFVCFCAPGSTICFLLVVLGTLSSVVGGKVSTWSVVPPPRNSAVGPGVASGLCAPSFEKSPGFWGLYFFYSANHPVAICCCLAQ